MNEKVREKMSDGLFSDALDGYNPSPVIYIPFTFGIYANFLAVAEFL